MCGLKHTFVSTPNYTQTFMYICKSSLCLWIIHFVHFCNPIETNLTPIWTKVGILILSHASCVAKGSCDVGELDKNNTKPACPAATTLLDNHWLRTI